MHFIWIIYFWCFQLTHKLALSCVSPILAWFSYYPSYSDRTGLCLGTAWSTLKYWILARIRLHDMLSPLCPAGIDVRALQLHLLLQWYLVWIYFEHNLFCVHQSWNRGGHAQHACNPLCVCMLTLGSQRATLSQEIRIESKLPCCFQQLQQRTAS